MADNKILLELRADVEQVKKELAGLDRQVKKSNDTQKKGARQAEQALKKQAGAAKSIIPFYNQIDGGLAKIGLNLQDITANSTGVKAALAQVGAGITSMTRAGLAFVATPIGAVIAGIAAASALFGKTAQQAIKLDSAFRGVTKTTGLSGVELSRFRSEIIDLSQELGSVSPADLAGVAEVAGQLGVTGRENLLKFTETIVRLGESSDVVGEVGAKSIARILNVTGEGVDSVDSFADSLVNLGNNSAATEAEILDAATSVATSTAQYKLGAQATLAYGAAAKSLGLESQVTGSALQRTFSVLDNALRGGKGLNELVRLTDQSADSLRELYQTDPNEFFMTFAESLGEVEANGGSISQVLSDFGLTSVQVNKVISTLSTNTDTLAESFELAANATGALEEESNKSLGSLQNQLKAVQVQLNNLFAVLDSGDGIVSKIIGAFTALALNGINNLIDGIQSVSAGFSTFSAIMGDLLAPLTTNNKFIDLLGKALKEALSPAAALSSSLRALGNVFVFIGGVTNGAVQSFNAFRSSVLDVVNTLLGFANIDFDFGSIDGFKRTIASINEQRGQLLSAFADVGNETAFAFVDGFDDVNQQFKGKLDEINQSVKESQPFKDTISQSVKEEIKETEKVLEGSLKSLRNQLAEQRKKLEERLTIDDPNRAKTIQLIAYLDLQISNIEQEQNELIQRLQDISVGRVAVPADIEFDNEIPFTLLPPDEVPDISDIRREQGLSLQFDLATDGLDLEGFDDIAISQIDELQQRLKDGEISIEEFGNTYRQVAEATQQRRLEGLASGFSQIGSAFGTLSQQFEEGSAAQVAALKLQAAANIAAAISNIQLSISQAAALPFPANLPAIASTIASVATIAGAVQSFGQSANDNVPSFYHGSEFISGTPSQNRKRDGIPAFINYGERIIPDYLNRPLAGISNAEIVERVLNPGQIIRNYNISVKDGSKDIIREMRMQERRAIERENINRQKQNGVRRNKKYYTK